MAGLSAGIALWRRLASGDVEVLLGHMGGPFWAKKDHGAWTIPKGLVEPGEQPIDAARREFGEELGVSLPPGELVPLGEFQQSKKVVIAWSLELVDHDAIDLDAVVSNTFEIEWPPRSGRTQRFPEIDRAAWFDMATARSKVSNGAVGLIDALVASLS
ncbi:MAG: NUDIX domain-containing protein [Ilumatobacter sp.]